MKVLLIGNSFSLSLGYFFPAVVRVNFPHSLELTSVYIGGCSLETHYNNLLQAEKDPAFAPYQITVWKSEDAPSDGVSRMGNFNECLKNNQYDIVTIQQASNFSWQEDSYEPFAGTIIDYIRKYQKNAEIVIQQTWSYRNDNILLQEWNITQDEMYSKARNAYCKLAERYGFRIIPMGDAVQLFRSRVPVKYRKPDREFCYPEEPDYSGDVVGCSYWIEKEGKMEFITDTIHLNSHGQFLQAAVWFACLYGEDPRKAAPAYPEELKSVCDLEMLLSCAADALK